MKQAAAGEGFVPPISSVRNRQVKVQATSAPLLRVVDSAMLDRVRGFNGDSKLPSRF